MSEAIQECTNLYTQQLTTIKKYLPNDISLNNLETRIKKGSGITKSGFVLENNHIINRMLSLIKNGYDMKKLDFHHILSDVSEIIPTKSKNITITIDELDEMYDELLDIIQTFYPQETKNSIETKKINPEILENATKVYKSGKFPEHVLNIWNKVWYKDLQIIRFILLIGASNKVLNAEEGLHLYISGKTDTGKSSSAVEALSYLPPEMRITSKFSKQWIYYGHGQGKLTGKQALLNDDTTFDDESAAIFRNILSGWLTGVTRETVEDSKNGKTLYVPPRVTLILTSVDGIVKSSNKGQDESRYTTMRIERTTQEMKEIKIFMQSKKPNVSYEKQIINAVFDNMEETEIEINQKFDTISVYKHKFGKLTESMVDHDLSFRELKKYRTMLMANALLHNRTKVNNDDIKEINEMLTYCTFMIKSDTPGFNENQMIVKEFLEQNSNDYLSIVDIAKGCKLDQDSVYVAMRGKYGSFEHPTGGLITQGIKIDDSFDKKHMFKIVFDDIEIPTTKKEPQNKRKIRTNEEPPAIF